jgi:hypothetical protein
MCAMLFAQEYHHVHPFDCSRQQARLKLADEEPKDKAIKLGPSTTG